MIEAVITINSYITIRIRMNTIQLRMFYMVRYGISTYSDKVKTERVVESFCNNLDNFNGYIYTRHPRAIIKITNSLI